VPLFQQVDYDLKSIWIVFLSHNLALGIFIIVVNKK